MTPLPFEHFTVNSYMLPSFVQSWVVSWIFLGVPSLVVIFGLSYLPILRRLRWRSVAGLLPLVGLLFGLAMGYLNVWGDHQSYVSDAPDHWYYLFGAPGNEMANAYGGDWQSDEAWDYRSDITIWNGLFWVTVASVAALFFRFVASRHTPNLSMQRMPASCPREQQCEPPWRLARTADAARWLQIVRTRAR